MNKHGMTCPTNKKALPLLQPAAAAALLQPAAAAALLQPAAVAAICVTCRTNKKYRCCCNLLPLLRQRCTAAAEPL
jgi:hypothetical protein